MEPLLIVGPFTVYRASDAFKNRRFYVIRDGKIVQWYERIEDASDWLNKTMDSIDGVVRQ
jgi:hypothetical protein